MARGDVVEKAIVVFVLVIMLFSFSSALMKDYGPLSAGRFIVGILALLVRYIKS